PLDPEEREARGITDTLIRISAGIEDIDDLIEDLDRGFEAMEAERSAVASDD
ncbi:MAG: cystathionine gamma-lyase, partial [Halobacteriales archaeon]